MPVCRACSVIPAVNDMKKPFTDSHRTARSRYGVFSVLNHI